VAVRAVIPRRTAGIKKAPAAGRAGLEIAGFRLNFKSDRPGIITILKARYARFASAGGAGYEFEVFEAPGRHNPFKPAVSFDGRSLEIKRGDFESVLDLRAGTGTLKAVPTEQCLDAFLRSLLSFLLLRSGGFMLHSAGLVREGKAYLFLGKSGAGKSTLSKLAAAAGVEVVSDEINLLRFENGCFRAYGSPFWGEMRADGRPGSWPLGGIYLLGKAKANRLIPCSGGEALRLLLRCLVNFDDRPGAAGNIMKNAVRLLRKARFSRLKFSKADGGFVSLVI